MVSPGIFEGLVIEVNLANPCFVEKGETSRCGGKIDNIPFEVSVKGVDGKEDTLEKTFSFCPHKTEIFKKVRASLDNLQTAEMKWDKEPVAGLVSNP